MCIYIYMYIYIYVYTYLGKEASTNLEPYRAAPRPGEFYCCTLQDFDPRRRLGVIVINGVLVEYNPGWCFGT